MKFRRRPNLLLLFLLPSLSQISSANPVDVREPLHDGTSSLGEPTTSGLANTNSANLAVVKPDIGTKDAPVDGKDGKPHAGPFVEPLVDKEVQAKEEEAALAAGKKPSPKPLKEASYLDGWKMPQQNDGVMDDPNRVAPEKGTTGTEGGVSEKDRDRKAQEGQTGEKLVMVPPTPPEAPPLPHSEQEKVDKSKGKDSSKSKEKGKDGKESSTGEVDKVDKPLGAAGIEKPADLPEKPHDLPPPVTPGNKDPLKISNPSETKVPTTSENEEAGLMQPFHSFVLAFTMIIFSEIGDKTFLIAALMAMKHDRILVFSAAASALVVMTVLSALFGHAVPTLLPKSFTNIAAAILFLIFGIRMLREGYYMSPAENVSEEMKEVEMELEEKEHAAAKGRRRSSISPYVLEAGRAAARKSRSKSRLPSPPDSPMSRSPSPSRSTPFQNALAGLQNLLSLLLSPAWVQTFVMTFLGEWGDRSQIATIAMAAGSDYWFVTSGAVTGHLICTAAAVIGGRAVAGKVSLRVVTLGGAITFLIFGFVYAVEAWMYY